MTTFTSGLKAATIRARCSSISMNGRISLINTETGAVLHGQIVSLGRQKRGADRRRIGFVKYPPGDGYVGDMLRDGTFELEHVGRLSEHYGDFTPEFYPVDTPNEQAPVPPELGGWFSR